MRDPKVLTDQSMRRMARGIRDAHWRTLERIAEHDPLWCCWWDKAGRYDTRYGNAPRPMMWSCLT